MHVARPPSLLRVVLRPVFGWGRQPAGIFLSRSTQRLARLKHHAGRCRRHLVIASASMAGALTPYPVPCAIAPGGLGFVGVSGETSVDVTVWMSVCMYILGEQGGRVAGQLQQSRRASQQSHWQLPTALSRPGDASASFPDHSRELPRRSAVLDDGPRTRNPHAGSAASQHVEGTSRSWVVGMDICACMQLGCCNHLSAAQGGERGRRPYRGMSGPGLIRNRAVWLAACCSSAR